MKMPRDATVTAVVGPKHPRSGWFVWERLLDAVSTFTELEARISRLPTDERGYAFEVFAEGYLATQPLHKAAKVWPLTEAPPSLLRRSGLEDRDYGVDGLVETHDGGISAYQVKFRSGRTRLTWKGECACECGNAGSGIDCRSGAAS